MSILTQQYQDKSIEFNISSTRKKQIIDLVGEVKNKEILDIGCATGYLGEYFKKQGNHVTGVDVSEKALDIARKKLDDVYLVDLESNNWPEDLSNKRFDIMIAAEIVEHLLYPEKFLQKLNGLLKDDGRVIITTPNFLVWSNRIKMLFGNFAYQEGGFWGRDHIHFFTLSELKKVLESSGWQVIKENHLKHPKVSNFLNKLLPSLFAFQLIVKAKKK